eukprot:738030-Pleurochrysis_carterae.AAC.1
MRVARDGVSESPQRDRPRVRDGFVESPRKARGAEAAWPTPRAGRADAKPGKAASATGTARG